MKQWLGLLCVMLAASVFAESRPITIGVQMGPSSLDPHFAISTPNQMVSLHLFDALMLRDDDMNLIPGLAIDWRRLDDLTWELDLRRGVRFHDGTPFTAEDVAFTVRRVPDIPHSPASFAGAVAEIEAVEVVDDHTIRFSTFEPFPMFINDIARLYIVSHRIAEGATTQDFNSGRAALGTGPYRLIDYAPGELIRLERNPDYWGRKPDVERLNLRVISNDAARVAALLSESVDMIDIVPPADRERLADDPRVRLSEITSARLIYLHMDHLHDPSPFIRNHRGRPLPENPLKDRRVRKALSLLIHRQAIVDRVLHGAGRPAGQLVPEGLFGYAQDLLPDPFDPERARRLLADAGYEDGFRLTIHGPNNRYINDGQVVMTVAQMLARGGIDMDVQLMPANVFFQRAARQEFSLFLLGYGSSSGDAFRGLRAVLASWDPVDGMGASNRGRYSNRDVDVLIRELLVEPDDDRRGELISEVSRIAFGDYAIIPLYFQTNMWATRPGLRYIPRRDERTLGINLRIER
ncbi:MAG: ABC transporter substrate-binding protein [Wenzhouxiangella sp.]|nr:ABC transporter substrate-binding protein [Wenzhouxiangella sp.]